MAALVGTPREPNGQGWLMSDTPETDPSPPESETRPESAPADPSEGAGPAEDRVAAAAGEKADAAEPVPVAGGSGGPRHTRRRLLLEAAAGALALALVAGGVAGGRVLGWWGPSEESTAAPTSTPTPTGTPMESPFAGTPAEDFAEGADGIVLPAAEPVGEFSAQEVAEALEQVRRALIAARLDETMLIDHDPEEFLSLLAPDQRLAVQGALETGEAGNVVSRISDGVEPMPYMPRVETLISYAAETVQGGDQVIRIITDSVWVYPLSIRNSAALVVVRDERVWRVRGEDWLESSQGLWLSSSEASVWGADCDAFEEGVLRPAGGSGPGHIFESSIFDLSQGGDPDGAC